MYAGGEIRNLNTFRFYVAVYNSIVTPLRLESFNAKANINKTSTVTWRTASEVNTLSFQIERSVDGVFYSSVGMVKAAGKPVNEYSFVDRLEGASSKYFYRLKMIDRDGSYSYSWVVKINFASSKVLSIFPNPAHTEVTLISAERRGEFSYASGVIVIKGKMTNSQTKFNLMKLSVGVYKVTLTTPTQNFTESLVIKR